MSEDTKVVEVEVTEIIALVPESTLEDVIAKMNELIEKVNSIKVRDRGPRSEKAMTEELACTILFDEKVAKMSHKKAAETLGLSYGQVSSVRGGYTFKKQYKLWREAGSIKTWDRDHVEA
tara:strand:- start:351 stop:710 length:360 start_codon:yes stop_codon:yes gene_type:complete